MTLCPECSGCLVKVPRILHGETPLSGPGKGDKSFPTEKIVTRLYVESYIDLQIWEDFNALFWDLATTWHVALNNSTRIPGAGAQRSTFGVPVRVPCLDAFSWMRSIQSVDRSTLQHNSGGTCPAILYAYSKRIHPNRM